MPNHVNPRRSRRRLRTLTILKAILLVSIQFERMHHGRCEGFHIVEDRVDWLHLETVGDKRLALPPIQGQKSLVSNQTPTDCSELCNVDRKLIWLVKCAIVYYTWTDGLLSGTVLVVNAACFHSIRDPCLKLQTTLSAHSFIVAGRYLCVLPLLMHWRPFVLQ